MPRYFLDENVQNFLAEPLRIAGYQLTTTREAGLNGFPDPAILREATKADSVVITADLDFANVVNFPLGTHSGIVVLRLKRLLVPAIVKRTLEALSSEIPDDMEGCLAIVDEFKTRTRRP